jgi:Predicted metal binding domain
MVQVVEPAVSKAKFEAEVEEFRALEGEYRAKGWILLEAEFPEVLLMAVGTKVNPPPVIFGALFDFTNYDADPPSLKLVNPFTREPYLAGQLPTSLNRGVAAEVPPGMPAPPGIQMKMNQPLMQAAQPDEIPFLCLAGVREYHAHPGHSGDSWELHRASGAGKLVRLLEILHRYGVDPLEGYGVELVPKVGLQYGEAPE